MKKFKGLLAMTLALTLICTSFVSVSAKGFKDVDEKKYEWCAEEISVMADKGIITGYTDGTFKPEKTVTKLESLALVARVLGSREEVNASLLENAKELYGEKVAEFDLSFGEDEICFLLLKGILEESELETYLGDGVANEGMKRYDMAVLLTKGMGAEKEVKDKVTAVLDYEDALKIPASARKYVEYVTKVGLMQGMGENIFSPMTDVTRAQAALVLYKLGNMTGYETFKGIVAAYNKASRTIRFKLEDNTNESFTIIPSAVTLRCDGEEIIADAIKVGWEAVVSLKDGSLAMIDFTTAQSDGIVAGRLMSVSTSSGETSLKVEYETAAGKESVSYKVSEDVVVTYDGEESSLTSIDVGDYVKLTVKSSKITVIDAETAKRTIKGGTVTAIDLSEGIVLTVRVNGEENEYNVKSTVKVSKNNSAADMSDIVIGDKVTLTLEYNSITNIEASSTTSNTTGIIQGVIISDTPVLRIKIGAGVEEYPIARNAKITLDGKEGTIYDLRLNTNATITLESESIIKINTTPAAEEAEVKGEVIGVNVSYNLIQVRYVDDYSNTENVEQVFVKTGAKIISTSSTSDKKLKDIKAGQIITAMGSRSSGVFEATTIIIRN